MVRGDRKTSRLHSGSSGATRFSSQNGGIRGELLAYQNNPIPLNEGKRGPVSARDRRDAVVVGRAEDAALEKSPEG